MELHLLTIFLPAVLCQFDIRPDVSFDDRNDRFDLTPLLQQGAADQWGDVLDGVRRAYRLNRRKNDETAISDATSKFMEALKGFQRNFDFNTPEQSDSDPGEKLQLRRDLVSYLHENQPGLDTRRSGQAEVDREVLMHHAVPIVMKVEGIMQLPREE